MAPYVGSQWPRGPSIVSALPMRLIHDRLIMPARNQRRGWTGSKRSVEPSHPVESRRRRPDPDWGGMWWHGVTGSRASGSDADLDEADWPGRLRTKETAIS